MASKKNNGKNSNTLKIVLLILVIFLLLGVGFGFGFGNGLFGPGSGSGTNGTGEGGEASQQGSESGGEVIGDTVIIKIEETKVTVNGVECKDKEELKAYLEKIYTDDKIFVLEENNAILGTYEWVEEACKEVGISLKK